MHLLATHYNEMAVVFPALVHFLELWGCRVCVEAKLNPETRREKNLNRQMEGLCGCVCFCS